VKYQVDLRDLDVKENSKSKSEQHIFCNYLITVVDTCSIIIFIELSIILSGKIVSKTSRKLVLINSSTKNTAYFVSDNDELCKP
jgi:hypothetical protein